MEDDHDTDEEEGKEVVVETELRQGKSSPHVRQVKHLLQHSMYPPLEGTPPPVFITNTTQTSITSNITAPSRCIQALLYQ